MALSQPVLASVVAPAEECCSVAPTSAADDLLGAACRTNSFVSGTEVLMADGSAKPIEVVEIGDWVWATDPVTGEAGPRQVIDTIVGDGQKHLVDIGILDGTITATDGHPFGVDSERRWVDAGELERCDELVLASRSTAMVEAVSDRIATERVHKLAVAGIHTGLGARRDTPSRLIGAIRVS